jgi:uncharacterized 2Fe-2S/4Fe-4S cluster protein (DUF4445 family)
VVIITPVSLVHFQPLGRKVEVKKGASLLDLAMEAGASIESICGSAGKCGKCRAVIRSGAGYLSPLTSNETRVLNKKDIENGFRLACQASIKSQGPIVVEVPEESRRGHHRLLEAGVERAAKLEPGVRKIVLRIPQATLKDLRADDDRLLDILQKKVRHRVQMSPGVHRDLPEALRKMSWVTTVTVFRDEEIIRAEPGDSTDDLYGIAIDIGTTKVAAYLLDLNSGRLLATESMPNPQIPFGEDVIARITFTRKYPDGVKKLQGVIIEGINSLISRLCEDKDISPEDVVELMVVGNTAMHHIFFGIPAHHLAAAPYAPAVRTSLCVNPGYLGINIYPFGKVCSLPNIAGFVGADAVSDLIASGLYADKSIGMVIDIGTNTEIIAGNRDRMLSCSCASGPAFEGAHIKFGMRASTGAIERVWIDPATHDVEVRTIDDSPAKGICGSGIVDAVSEMFRTGLIDTSGKIVLDKDVKGIRRDAVNMPELVLVPGTNSASGDDITITQHDVQEIQLAKAAIFTGVSILLRKLRVKASNLKSVYAAGAFGTYVDAGSAIAIGMYPDVLLERIKFIGNSAGAGARMCLKSLKMCNLAEELSKKVEYVELAAEKDFQNEFAQAMFLPHRDLSRFPNASSRRPKAQ